MVSAGSSNLAKVGRAPACGNPRELEFALFWRHLWDYVVIKSEVETMGTWREDHHCAHDSWGGS